jgi:tetratricopeptide (TPR) repeat protein
MSKLAKAKEKAKNLEARDPKGAIDAWLDALRAQEDEGEANPDLTIYNRIGDLYLKLKDAGQAADYYERAVDKYAELGFHNNAIAMCNKVLRCAPGRPTTYLKLAKLYAAKGFLAEAKQNFVQYADRMHGAGKIQQAFVALREVTDLTPEGAGLKHMLEEHLKMYGAAARGADVATPAPGARPPESKADLSKSGKRKSSSLVFLDLDEPPTRGKTSAPSAKPPVAAAPSPPVGSTDDLVTEFAADPDSSIDIQPTSLADDAPAAGSTSTIEGFEQTSAFNEAEAGAPSVPSVRDEEPTADDVELVSDFEATAGADSAPSFDSVDLEGLEDTIEIAEPPPPPKRAAPPPPPPAAKPPQFAPKRPAPAAPEAPKVKPFAPKRPAADEPPAKRKPVIEVPDLELEPDFDTETASAAPDEPLALDEPPARGGGGGGGGRQSGFIDLTLDDEYQGSGAESLASPGATIEELEGRVADDPDDPDAHRELGEALIEAGDRERGIEELDHATAGLENRGELDRARDLVEEVLHLDPNSVRHRQKQVEFAFKSGDRARLVDAYLELADTLLRGDLPEKARAVYQRVAEHEPQNERAKAALAMLAPVTSRPPEPKAPAREGRVAAKDAKMKVREDAGGDEASFIDLGAMILDDDAVARDTRMKVADEEPTGDEERDFHDMLARFKQGIAENIDEGDFQSHYDLGVAFKEMGLLDEAIAEFQKALRAPEGKLRTSEALGACFIEKGAFVVAESILRRGLELPASGDQERVGVLYWLGRALEETGKKAEARDLYGRVFAVDIHFHDVAQRVKALARAK